MCYCAPDPHFGKTTEAGSLLQNLQGDANDSSREEDVVLKNHYDCPDSAAALFLNMFNLGLKLMCSRLVVSQQVLTKAWLLKQGSVHISTVVNSVLIRRWKASDCTCCHDTSRTSLLGSMRQNKSLVKCAATALYIYRGSGKDA